MKINKILFPIIAVGSLLSVEGYSLSGGGTPPPTVQDRPRAITPPSRSAVPAPHQHNQQGQPIIKQDSRPTETPSDVAPSNTGAKKAQY